MTAAQENDLTMMMSKTLFVAAAACLLAVADSATTVAVLELGTGGTVRRTTSKNAKTTVAGVASFWSSLHGGIPTRSFAGAHAGQTVVPDLFLKADGGIVLGLTGVDLAVMPTLSNLVEEEGESNRVVGHLEMEGNFGRHLLNKVGIAEEATTNSIQAMAHAKSQQKGLSAMRVKVNEDNASDIDSQIASLVERLHKEALNNDRTVVLHIVVEEEEGAASRRLATRRLEENREGEQEGEGEEENRDEGQEGEGEENREGEDGSANGEGKASGYYGYGYYNSYGEWVTPYKTMFQIQYFNVVLWSSLGLTLVLFFSIYLIMYMPLEADTLLFGESAKMMGE